MPSPWRPSSAPVDLRSLAVAIDRHPMVVVHFWAAWNRIDRPFDEALRVAGEGLGGRIAFRSFDADRAEGVDLIRAYGVGNLPALACFLGGRHVETIVGLRPPGELRRRLAAWLGRAGAE